MWPAGPMDVLNMRLNSIGGERSLPVLGDFMLYCWIVSPMSAILIPSTYNHSNIANRVRDTGSDQTPHNRLTQCKNMINIRQYTLLLVLYNTRLPAPCTVCPGSPPHVHCYLGQQLGDLISKLLGRLLISQDLLKVSWISQDRIYKQAWINNPTIPEHIILCVCALYL